MSIGGDITFTKRGRLQQYIQQARDFAEVLDEEGMDRDGLHFAINAICNIAEHHIEPYAEDREAISEIVNVAAVLAQGGHVPSYDRADHTKSVPAFMLRALEKTHDDSKRLAIRLKNAVDTLRKNTKAASAQDFIVEVGHDFMATKEWWEKTGQVNLLMDNQPEFKAVLYALRVADAMSWRPIDAAPKDFQQILAVGYTFDGQPIPIVARFEDGVWKEPSTRQHLHTLKYWSPLPPPPQEKK